MVPRALQFPNQSLYWM
ncbi:Protein of unknown function [Pyronema omphalodes CBS 100304]|uniref:Uncharacterized protein n=1 Tax=Pyronema omphalodes (strain CBS 100304) TaxID=1076935 RepID=U4LW99_PYROM|nr:Protein of unknown function [Pyronema omphalodes CBS 100304]